MHLYFNSLFTKSAPKYDIFICKPLERKIIYMDMHKGKYKIILIFAIFFIIVSTLLALIFYAGKKSHNVRFDINGGTLLSLQ